MDEPWELPMGSMLHMPIFEWRDKESERRREQKGESCRIHGRFDVNRRGEADFESQLID